MERGLGRQLCGWRPPTLIDDREDCPGDRRKGNPIGALTIRLERQISRLAVDARKLDTRNKIQLGGLVIKAGLAEEDAAVLLGILVSAAEALAGLDGDFARQRFRRTGDRVFTADQKKLAR